MKTTSAARAVRIVLIAVFGALLLTACKPIKLPHLPHVSVTRTSQSATPVAAATTCAGTITWIAGSMPPPYHYEWTLTLNGTTGNLSMTPGYGDKTRWTKSFTVAAGADQTLCDAVRAIGPGSGGEAGVGGSLMEASLVSSGEVIRYDSPGHDESVINAAKQYIPAGVWAGVYGQYQAWAAKHPN